MIRVGMLAALIAMGLIGCRSDPETPATETGPTRMSFDLPPQQLVDRVEQLLAQDPFNLHVTDQGQGHLITDYQSFPGAVVGVGDFGRHWQERTRYLITISPDWKDPNHRSSVEVRAETQQRSTEHHDWNEEPEVNRPQRAAALLDKLDRAIRG